MENHLSPIEVDSLLKFFGCLFILTIVLVFAAWKVAKLYYKYELKKEQYEKAFYELYREIDDRIRLCEKNEKNRKEIQSKIKELSSMPFTNREYIETSWQNYLNKFYDCLAEMRSKENELLSKISAS